MPYVLTKESYQGFKDELIGKIISGKEDKGPISDIKEESQHVVIHFVYDIIKGEKIEISPINEKLYKYLSLLNKETIAVMPDENNEEWSLVGVDPEMVECVGKKYKIINIDMVEGVPSIYMNNEYWYPASYYNDLCREENEFLGYYYYNSNEGWIKNSIVIGNKVFIKTMNDTWFIEDLDSNLIKKQPPTWLSAKEFVVLLNSCDGKDCWKQYMPINHVYQLSEDASLRNFMIEKDIKGSDSNGWHNYSYMLPYNGLKLRPATSSEIHLYWLNQGPIPINNSPSDKKEIDESVKEPIFEKTKRLSSKNYL